jgi:hypothetical protein
VYADRAADGGLQGDRFDGCLPVLRLVLDHGGFV